MTMEEDVILNIWDGGGGKHDIENEELQLHSVPFRRIKFQCRRVNHKNRKVSVSGSTTSFMELSGCQGEESK